MRVLACVLAATVVLAPSAAATPHGLEVLVRDGAVPALVHLDRTSPFTQPLRAGHGDLAFSGDGRLVSIGGTIVGRATLPTRSLVWAPTGERAAYTTTEGAVVVWTPAGKRRIEPKGWGAQTFLQSLAWSPGGALAIQRGHEIWVWRDGVTRRIVGPVAGVPMPFAWSGGRVLWWQWPDSSSIAADGVSLYANDVRLGTTLAYRDYVATCGSHVVFASGGDRYAMDDKKIVLDGRDISRDPRHSWVSPSCAGNRVVASASRNLIPARLGREHRSIWQLLPTRRQLTRPPWGWTDEQPHLFADGSMVFLRVHTSARREGDTWRDSIVGRVILLAQGKLRVVATTRMSTLEDARDLYLPQYYGHYVLSPLLAVRP